MEKGERGRVGGQVKRGRARERGGRDRRLSE